MKALNETDAQIDSMIGTIKNNIENLGKKQDEVRALEPGLKAETVSLTLKIKNLTEPKSKMRQKLWLIICARTTLTLTQIEGSWLPYSMPPLWV